MKMKESELSPLELVWEARRKIWEGAGGTIAGLMRYYAQCQRGIPNLITTKEQLDEIARKEPKLKVSRPKAPHPDPVIAEIREVRRRIAAECDNDPQKYCNYLKEAEAELKAAGRKFISYPFSDAVDKEESIALKEKPARKYGKH
jgi:hypothetical protein